LVNAHSNKSLPRIVDACKKLSTEDPKAKVRVEALNMLVDVANSDTTHAENMFGDLFRHATNDRSYAVVAAALEGLFVVNKKDALLAAKSLKNLESDQVKTSVAYVLLMAEDSSAHDYIISLLNTFPNGQEKYNLVSTWGQYIKMADEATQQKCIEVLKDMALNNSAWWMRLVAAMNLYQFHERENVKTFLLGLKQTETNPRVKTVYAYRFNFE